MQAYLRAGEERAFALGNRGPIRFEADGRLAPDILAAYWRCGFYVFEGVLAAQELADIEADVKEILERLPHEKGAAFDQHGRPALAADCTAPNAVLVQAPGGSLWRHQPRQRAPSRQDVRARRGGGRSQGGRLSDPRLASVLRGVPARLWPSRAAGVAAAINGEDFVPFNEALFIKAPGLGASVAWHRDGTTH
jgi:phytanoyl-CoA dioxygenase PhyH